MATQRPSGQVLNSIRNAHLNLRFKGNPTPEEKRALRRLSCVLDYFDPSSRRSQSEIAREYGAGLRSVARWIALVSSDDQRYLDLVNGFSRSHRRNPGLSEEQKGLVRELLKTEEEASRNEFRKPRRGKAFLSFLSANHGISLSRSQWRYWQRTLKPSPWRKGRWEV